MLTVSPTKHRSLISVLLVSIVGLGLAGCGAGPRLLGPGLEAGGYAAAGAKKPQGGQFREPKGYYTKAEGLTGQKLLRELQRVTRKNHRDLGYDKARDVMFQTIDDLDGDDRFRTVYTGYQVAGVVDRKTAYHQGINAEHTWPQSMGAVGIAKSDLHHLFPALMEANSTRNNNPMGNVAKIDFVLPDYAGDGLTSRIGHTGDRKVFEPRKDHKGNVARAMLYFYMRYANHEGEKSHLDLTNFTFEQDTMLAWHQQDPVDEAEMARNHAIHKAQGNRNPFVDHPEWVGKVGKFIPAKKGTRDEE